MRNSDGESSTDVNHEYMYNSDAVAMFTADQPGTYQLRVTVETMGADNVTGEVGARAEYLTTIDANGEATSSGGCSIGATNTSGGFALMIACVALLWRRRR